MKMNVSSLNENMIKEYSWAHTMVIGYAEHCHLVVICPTTVVTIGSHEISVSNIVI